MKITGLYLLIMVSFVGLSVDSLFLVWAVMEWNMLLFIPLMTFVNENHLPMMLGLKYYFVQSLASILFLVSIIMAIQSNQKNFSELVMIISISWKMGVPPFHLWMMNLMMGLDWWTFFIMSTWQKMLPFYVLSEMAMPMIDFLIILSLVVSVGLSFEQSSIKKVMIVSSIFTGAWIMSALMISKMVWTLVMLTYAGMLFPTLMIFKNDKGVFNYSFLLSLNSFSEKLMLFLFLMSLAGLPPLAGFYLKMIVIFVLLSHSITALSCLLILSSVLMIFMYATLLIFSLVCQITKSKFIISRSHVNFFFLFGMSMILFFPMILLG